MEPLRPRGEQPVTVSQAAAMIKSALAEALPARVRVVGQVSNFSERAHWFFSLKDDQAALRCVCFASTARRLNLTLRDGMEVVATGRFDYYEAQGHIQLYVDRLEPVGQGALELRFRALCEELRQLGYFEEQRKKPLPLLPQRVAVVTSRGAAALQDVINTAGQRWPGCRLYLCDVRVQGAAAAPEIAAALDRLSRQGPQLGINAVLLTRGGGSIEDLWAFNERIVADAVFRCPLPVVAAIGHETDTTIAELVADLRCSTPTQAAMALVPDRRALLHQAGQFASRLSLLMRREVDQRRQRLSAAVRHRFLRRPELLCDPLQQRVRDLAARLHAVIEQRMAASRQRLRASDRHSFLHYPGRMIDPAQRRLREHQQKLVTAMARRWLSERSHLAAQSRQLEAVGPMAVLRRGYSYTLNAQGQVIRSTAAVQPQDVITTVLTDGRVRSRVEEAGNRPRTPASGAKPRRRDGSPSPGLFD